MEKDVRISISVEKRAHELGVEYAKLQAVNGTSFDVKEFVDDYRKAYDALCLVEYGDHPDYVPPFS